MLHDSLVRVNLYINFLLILRFFKCLFVFCQEDCIHAQVKKSFVSKLALFDNEDSLYD